MQQQQISPKKLAVIVISLIVGFIAIITLAFFLSQSDDNQFGKFIRIQNYDQQVKNLDTDMRDAMESQLYNTVDLNVSDTVDISGINDAFIRDSSETQNHNQRTSVYDGSFIVDMESIKQSYLVQYSYSRSNTVDIGGSPIVVSCLPEEQLKYGKFKCDDLISSQSAANDKILQYLPYENFSFKLYPDATQGEELVLVATLDIPQVDLKGDASSNAQVVAMYKKEVTDWISSKGVNPSDYIIQFNYDDAGNIIFKEEHHGD